MHLARPQPLLFALKRCTPSIQDLSSHLLTLLAFSILTRFKRLQKVGLYALKCPVFLQVGVHSMGTIFQQHRRLGSSRNRTVGTRRPFFLGYLVMRACSLRYEPPSNLTSLPWCTVRSINAAAMFLSPSTRPQPENSMFVV